MRDKLILSGREVSQDAAPYIIAEAGVHHRNSVTLAKELILRARANGADALKFQTYSADRIAAKWAPTYWDDGTARTQHDIFAERSLLTESDYEELFRYAAEVGITLLSTPFDTGAAAMLDALGMEAFKIASADVTNVPLLEHVAAYGKPVLLSTGAARFDEIADAVAIFERRSAPYALLHCNLAYPTGVSDANLKRIMLLAERFPGVVIGYSDHTRPQDSEVACPLAVGLGARVVEKHFTLNKLLPEDDHDHAVDPQGLSRLVKACRDAWMMTRSAVEMTESEQVARTYARRSIVAARSMPAGHVLTESDVDFKRPGTGIPPSKLVEVLGRRLRRDVDADDLITLDVLDA